MRKVPRTVLSLGLTLSLLIGTLMTVIAQSESSEEAPIAPAAGINADTVDGRHAVGATSDKAKRARKLVATDRRGLLPSNIVKPLWSLMKGVPSGFADGVDDVGYVRQFVTGGPFSVAAGSSTLIMLDLDDDIDADLTIVSSTNYSTLWMERGFYRVDGDIKHLVRVRNDGGEMATFEVRVRIYAPDTTAAALKRQLRDARITVSD